MAPCNPKAVASWSFQSTFGIPLHHRMPLPGGPSESPWDPWPSPPAPVTLVLQPWRPLGILTVCCSRHGWQVYWKLANWQYLEGPQSSSMMHSWGGGGASSVRGRAATPQSPGRLLPLSSQAWLRRGPGCSGKAYRPQSLPGPLFPICPLALPWSPGPHTPVTPGLCAVSSHRPRQS